LYRHRFTCGSTFCAASAFSRDRVFHIYLFGALSAHSECGGLDLRDSSPQRFPGRGSRIIFAGIKRRSGRKEGAHIWKNFPSAVLEISGNETRATNRENEEEGRGLLRLIMIAVFRVTRRSIIVVQLPRMRNTRASVFRPPAPRINNHARLMTGDFFPSFFSFAHATNRRRCLRGVIRSRKNIYRKYLLRAL